MPAEQCDAFSKLLDRTEAKLKAVQEHVEASSQRGVFIISTKNVSSASARAGSRVASRHKIKVLMGFGSEIFHGARAPKPCAHHKNFAKVI